jgi:hypothetical protein
MVEVDNVVAYVEYIYLSSISPLKGALLRVELKELTHQKH